MPTTGALDVIQPFAWLATIAFLVGFCSYLMIGKPETAFAQEGARATAAAAISGPSSDEWNLPKRI